MDHTTDEVLAPTSDASQEAVPVAMDEAEILALPFSVNEAMVESVSDLGEAGKDDLEKRGDPVNTSTKPTLPPMRDRVALPTRPALKRDQSNPFPTPQHLPPPAPPAPPSDIGPPTDSISLMQLRRLVNDMPKVEPTPYAFEYEDASSFPEELEEWFTYAVEEQAMILRTQSSFVREWLAFNGMHSADPTYEEGRLDWLKAGDIQRQAFVQKLLGRLQHSHDTVRLKCLEALTYIVLGCWYETAGLLTPSDDHIQAEEVQDEHLDQENGTNFAKSALQIEWIKTNVRYFINAGGLPIVFDIMRTCCHRTCSTDGLVADASPDKQELDRVELFCSLTILYLCVETARSNMAEPLGIEIRTRACDLEPDFLLTLLDYISRIRWDESIPLPLAKVLLLMWKFLILRFGGLAEVEQAKSFFKDRTLEESDKHGQPLITASPLDYHLFRQEISSKYPAYNPPPPLFPLEPENNSILPPLKNHPNKYSGSNIYGSGLANINGNATSILHQPVHIATPAPSPPPSPAGPGGKGGKKQNYQTNQLFPFLYPPLDESSNNLGGKGTTGLQDILVGRKWEGSDIPTSILEAAELFAKRMRATRAMKQLWEVRVQFMKYERGWAGADDDDVDALTLDGKIEPLNSGADEYRTSEKIPVPGPSIQRALEHTELDGTEERLTAVESFYSQALPQLQSLIIVLMRVVLNHVTAIVTQANGPNGLQSGFQFQDAQNGSSATKTEANGMTSNFPGDNSISVEELDTIRSQEILDKALSGILILLIKWFKVSHILKFEYVTQLLVDSSYIPLVLKLLQLQEIERVVAYKCDREDLNFFHFCNTHSRIGLQEPKQRSVSPSEKDVSSDEDEAIPPPIKRRRDSPPLASEGQTMPSNAPVQPPEVDELGFPTSDLPAEPITTFSWRAFFTSINYLRILQKICKGKAHRNLMLVSYKSSQVLRKCLRVPQPGLRLYTLKLFKNQVPYCGRKWRQTNMRVITAVYLHCRPELRDEWLSGSDVDAEVDESVPLEQALRALTHWWNLRWYPEAMGARQGVLDEERDFFRQELEKMSWGDDVQGEGDGLAATSDTQWDVGVEGW